MRFEELINRNGSCLSVLVDPDKFDKELIGLLDARAVKFILVGGSKLKKNTIKQTVVSIKNITNIPVILFPGDESQLCKEADGIFILSLVSGKDPEYLIGKQIRSAQKIKQLKLATFPVAYILVHTGTKSQTQKVTGTTPLKAHSIIVDTAIAAQHLGFKAVYLEAGSGSKKSLDTRLINKVSKSIDIPLIVGGGIVNATGAKNAKNAGANIVVVGNALEKNKLLIHSLSKVFV